MMKQKKTSDQADGQGRLTPYTRLMNNENRGEGKKKYDITKNKLKTTKTV